MVKERKWVMTISELAGILDMSRQAIYPWLNKIGWPAKTKRGWNIIACQEFIKNWKTQQIKQTSGVNASEKRQKLELECAILNEKLLILKGKNLPLQELFNELRQFVAIVNNVFEQWIQYVEAITRAPLLVQKARDLENSMREKLREKIESLKK